MSSRPLLGTGQREEDSAYVQGLERQIAKLQSQLVDQQALVNDRDAAMASMRALRNQLQPWYEAMQRLFGDLEDAGVGIGASPRSTGEVGGSPVWDSWKSRLGGKCPEFIDLLLVHRQMSAAQLMAAARCAKKTVYDTVFRMNKAGILEKNGSLYSLRQL